MKIGDIQYLLQTENFYEGALDGVAGKGTRKAVEDVLEAHSARRPDGVENWGDWRRMIAAVQILLNATGCEAGHVDGYAGENTEEAMLKFRAMRGDLHVSQYIVAKTDQSHKTRAQSGSPRQCDVEKIYGPAGSAACTAGKVILPISFKIAWQPDKKIRRFSCHEKVEDQLNGIFEDAVEHYGEYDFRKLELDMFGGCYNYRKMRGGLSLSMHAFGIAVDLNPANNRLRWGADKAQFARSEYDDFWKIVKSHGGTPAGHAWGRDWMHFQFARL